jgi:hypothetical protein
MVSEHRKRWPTDGFSHMPIRRRADCPGPETGDPPRLQLEQWEVRALQGELPDHSEGRQVGVDRPVVQRELRTGRPPNLVGKVRQMQVVARRADDRVDDLRRPVRERHRAPVDVGNRRAARDPAVSDQGQIVLRERVARNEDVVVGSRCAEVGGVSGHPDHTLSKQLQTPRCSRSRASSRH